MKIAIIGPAGSGKSTFARELDSLLPFRRGFVILDCDRLVNDTYAHWVGSEEARYARKVCPQCFNGQRIDKGALGTFLLQHPKERAHLENLFFKRVKAYVDKQADIVVEGILPRFLKKLKFDVVLYVHTNAAERRRRLKKRGVTQARIKEIERVQRRLFRNPVREQGVFPDLEVET